MKTFLLLTGAALCLDGLLSAQPATLRAGDTIRLEMRGIPDGDSLKLNGNYRIGQDGKVVGLPFLGDEGVKGAGLTEDQLAKAITAAYRKADIYSKAEASVLPAGEQAPPRQIMIVGKAARPGPVAYADRMTAIDAVAAAGGPDKFGQLKRVTLFREGQPNRLLDLTQNADKLTPILPGDRLEIDRKGLIE